MQTKQIQRQIETNIILISGEKVVNNKITMKPLNVYLKSVEISFKTNKSVYIMARGKAISRAIDLAEYCKRVLNVKINKIESFTSERVKDNKKLNISEIKIELIK